jgi:hypothetical protein
MRISYNILFDNEKYILLQDCSSFVNYTKSITNSAEEVVGDLVNAGFFNMEVKPRLFYVDSCGIVDEIIVSRKKFKRFEIHNLTVSGWCKRFGIDWRCLKVTIDPIIIGS